MQYLAWRILTGLNKITLSLLIVGHTKFSPDWCFGLFKQAFRRTKVGCLDDIARVVEESAVASWSVVRTVKSLCPCTIGHSFSIAPSGRKP